MSGEEKSDPAGRSLVKRCQESEPALMSVMFSFHFFMSVIFSLSGLAPGLRTCGYAAHSLCANMRLLAGYL